MTLARKDLDECEEPSGENLPFLKEILNHHKQTASRNVGSRGIVGQGSEGNVEHVRESTGKRALVTGW